MRGDRVAPGVWGWAWWSPRFPRRVMQGSFHLARRTRLTTVCVSGSPLASVRNPGKHLTLAV